MTSKLAHIAVWILCCTQVLLSDEYDRAQDEREYERRQYENRQQENEYLERQYQNREQQRNSQQESPQALDDYDELQFELMEPELQMEK